MTELRWPSFAAAIFGTLGVLLGAFGAHALRGTLDEHALGVWQTAVQYQMWHALALLGTGVLAQRSASAALRASALAFALGIVLFSGSLYALALGAPRWTGIVTPLGGLAFVGGWIALAAHARRA